MENSNHESRCTPRKLTWQLEWRCISYGKWGFSSHVSELRGVSPHKNPDVPSLTSCWRRPQEKKVTKKSAFGGRFQKRLKKQTSTSRKGHPEQYFPGALFSDFCQKSWRAHHHWVLVSNMCCLHPYLGFHDPIWLAHMFQTGGEKSQDTSGRRWRLRTGGRCYPNFQPKKGLLSRQKETTTWRELRGLENAKKSLEAWDLAVPRHS